MVHEENRFDSSPDSKICVLSNRLPSPVMAETEVLTKNPPYDFDLEKVLPVTF